MVVATERTPTNPSPVISTPPQESAQALAAQPQITTSVSDVKLIVLRHILGMAMIGLLNPAVWRSSPTFMFGVGAVLAPWIINIAIAAVATGAGYVFFTDAIRARWVQVFLWTGWIFTALTLIGRLLT